MGFEFIYAYLENLHWFFMVGLAATTIFLVILLIMRKENNMDIDDWTKLMFFDVGGLFFFALLAISPGMEHVKQVHDTITAHYGQCPVEQVTPFWQLTNHIVVGTVK